MYVQISNNKRNDWNFNKIGKHIEREGCLPRYASRYTPAESETMKKKEGKPLYKHETRNPLGRNEEDTAWKKKEIQLLGRILSHECHVKCSV